MTSLRNSSESEIVAREYEEKIFQQVVDELKSGTRREGLWAKAYTESDGDELKTRALYIRYRAQSLIDETNKEHIRVENERKASEQRATEKSRRFEEVMQDIRKRKPNISDIWNAAEYGDVEALELLLSIGVKINKQRTDGVTPLYLAALNGKWHCVEYLLDHGANPEIRNHKGRSARDAASVAGHPEIVDMFAQHVWPTFIPPVNINANSRPEPLSKKSTSLTDDVEIIEGGTFDHTTNSNSEKESVVQENLTNMPMRWGFTWVYIIMPLRALFGLFAGLGLAMQNQSSTDLTLLFGGTYCVIVLAITIGYYQRRTWAWWLNWLTVLEFIMVTGILWFPTPRLNTIGLILGILLCGIPSTIYWRKRKEMFA